MRFKIVPSTRDGRHQLLTTYLINETLAIDAGAIAIGLSVEEQLRLRSIIITHAHLDHIFSLPLYLTDLFDEIRDPIKLYATPADLEAVQQHLFNHRVWVTLETLMNGHKDLISFHPIKSAEPFVTEGLKITPIPVSHTVLTHGVLVEDEECALLFTSDTGKTDRIWKIARDCAKLRAVFIDISFPNRLTDLARVSCHHSPSTLLEEMPKIKEDVQVFAVHLKAAYRDQVAREIAALNDPRLFVAEVGREYEF
ncbi:MAG: 3',5'-cyclic-nucleotide phosphodiesterase [Blastocatellia bacterium]|nr:3',5'-cyclic-nucleotide phosphodiesterase [Blastocatellia bacterium]